jgi:hypothetical protein
MLLRREGRNVDFERVYRPYCGRASWLMELRPGWLVSTGAMRGPRARS